MKRIIITGASGSGKTYTARKLSMALDITNYDLDDYGWNSEWQLRDKHEFTESINTITQQKTWIISGNFSSLEQYIWQRCDTLIWLDYNICRCLIQSFTRSIGRIIRKTPCCNGNYETFKQLFFSRNSIILWVLTSYNKRRAFYREIFRNNNNQKTLLKFSNPKQTNAWLKNNFSL